MTTQANETHTTSILTSVFPFLFSSFSKIRPLFFEFEAQKNKHILPDSIKKKIERAFF